MEQCTANCTLFFLKVKVQQLHLGLRSNIHVVIGSSLSEICMLKKWDWKMEIFPISQYYPLWAQMSSNSFFIYGVKINCPIIRDILDHFQTRCSFHILYIYKTSFFILGWMKYICAKLNLTLQNNRGCPMPINFPQN